MNEAREKATVKLIPRIDLQAMARKFVIYHLCSMLFTLLFFSAQFSGSLRGERL